MNNNNNNIEIEDNYDISTTREESNVQFHLQSININCCCHTNFSYRKFDHTSYKKMIDNL